MIAIRSFVEERNRIIDQHEKKEEEKRSMENALPKISPEDWCRQTGLPECHSAIEVYHMRDRIINHIEALVYAIGVLHKIVCAL